VAHIVIITHTYDDFTTRNFFLRHIAKHWVKTGHSVSVVAGLGTWPQADVAIMHVDLALLPQAYVEAAKRYPVVLNGAATDIRKRHVSRNLVRPNDGWTGPVIVKTDLNSRGGPERRILRRMRGGSTANELPPYAIGSSGAHEYRIVDSPGTIPEAIWEDPAWVVERFLPERDARGYWARAWVFLGDRERCGRYLAHEPLVKGANITLREEAQVPDALRAERERLGFDFGKFDFVICNDEPVLFDANRTPWGHPAANRAMLKASDANLAHGIERWLAG
jgi:hypothetical protein